jgi:hypothetical protein
MIHITKYFNEQDRNELYHLLSRKKQGKKAILEDLMERGNQHQFRQDLYANQRVQDKLLSFFHGKCAYCEDFRGNQRKNDGKPNWDWQMEHFRPKAGVSEDRTHEGYYWLSYECTNFLAGCYTCNQQYKGTQFPIMDGSTRLTADAFIENARLKTACCDLFHPLFNAEEPVLIHPAKDKPEAFIEFLADGTVHGKNLRGEKSIEIYGLNRQLLIAARKKIIDNIMINLNVNLEFCEQNIDKQLLKRILNYYLEKLVTTIDEPTSTFIAFRRTILGQFDNFIINNNSNIILHNLDFMQRYQTDLLSAYWEILGKKV